MKSVCCVAGKSGGHIIPCLQFAMTQHPNTPISFISTNTALDQKIKTQFPIIYDHRALDLVNVPYKRWLQLPFFLFSFLKAIVVSFWYLKKHRPTDVISTGGFIALPVCMAAKLLRIPITLFELNAVPGKATQVVSRFSDTTLVCFKEAQKYFKHKTTVTPYPLRFNAHDKQYAQKEVRQSLGLDATKKTICILGGSQGSEFLNGLIRTIPSFKDYQIIHQTGSADVIDCQNFYTSHAIQADVFAFKANLAPYYQAADFIICRAGAGTLFEVLFFEKKCLIIPLETSITDHQLDNAQAMHKAYPHLFSVIRQQEITKNPNMFFKALP